MPDVQQATQDALVTQQARSLSVMPRPVLGPILRQAGQTYEAAQRLDLEARRLAMEHEQARFKRRMAPWAIGIGALDLGVGVLGAVRTARTAREATARAKRMEALGEATLAEQRAMTAAVLDALARRRRGLLAPASTQEALRPTSQVPLFDLPDF